MRFVEDCMTERIKHEMEYSDNSIFENLSIFKDVNKKDEKKEINIVINYLISLIISKI